MAVWDELLSSFPPYVKATVAVVIVVVVAIVLERLIAGYMKRLTRRNEWPLHVTNGLLLVFRLLILLGAIATLLRIGEVPTESIVAFSALGGAAVGFASTRTLGNIIAGLFVFVTRPFRVNDYVKIDSVEGVVEEITFNYTKIRTQSNTLVFISNLKILDQNVANYRCLGERSRVYCYSVFLGFDHNLTTQELERMFDGVIKQYSPELPRKPEYVMQGITAFERRYMFNLYVVHPSEIFTLQPAFVRDITEAWERAKKK